MSTNAKSPHLQTVTDGIVMGECPRWHEGRLWFADWIGQKLYSIDASGQRRVEAAVASLPFSIDWLADGTLLVAHAWQNKLLRRQADGAFATHSDLATLSAFGCNELVVDGRGNIYVNSINEALEGGPMASYVEFERTGLRPGVIGLVSPDGTVRQVAQELAFPNGMVVTPDNKTLIVAESFSAELTAFDIAEDGSLENRRLWARIEGQGADGICLDAEGAVWASSGPRCIRIAEGGQVLDEVGVDPSLMCFACMLGGADGRTLFIVANAWGSDAPTRPTGKVFALPVGAQHAGFP